MDGLRSPLPPLQERIHLVFFPFPVRSRVWEGSEVEVWNIVVTAFCSPLYSCGANTSEASVV